MSTNDGENFVMTGRFFRQTEWGGLVDSPHSADPWENHHPPIEDVSGSLKALGDPVGRKKKSGAAFRRARKERQQGQV